MIKVEKNASLLHGGSKILILKVVYSNFAQILALGATSGLVDAKIFLCCDDFGACGDVCGGGCAVGGRGDVSGGADAGDGIDVRDDNAFSEIGDGAALKVQWGW